MSHYDQTEQAADYELTAAVRALTSCTHPAASNGTHAYRDGVCRCGALKRNTDGSVPRTLRTRYGVAITEIDAAHSYVGTYDGMGHGAPTTPTYGAPTVARKPSTPTAPADR